MTGDVFVDTNVLLYARDGSEKRKQPRAEAWLRALWRKRTGRTSIQVLNEFYQNVTRKLSPGLPAPAARDEVRELLAWDPVPIDADLLEAAWDAEQRWKLPFRDALIVAAAQRAECGLLLSEDFQAGHSFDGVLVVDPFATAPESVMP